MFGSRSSVASTNAKMAQVQAQPSIQQPLPQPGVSITPSVVSAPRVTSVTPRSTPISTPWNSTNTDVVFDLPKTLSKLTDVYAQLKVSCSTTDASGTDLIIPPSPLLFQRVELLYNGTDLERVDGQEILTEAMLWVDDQTAALNAARWNVGALGGLADSFNVTTSAAVTKTYYVPIFSASMLKSIQPHLKSFNGQWSYRFVFANSAVASALKTGTATASSATVSFSEMLLFCTEQVLPPEQDKALVAAHQRGTYYKCIHRKKVAYPLLPSIPAASITEQQLSGFNNQDVAGIQFYVQPQAPTIAQLMAHSPLSNFQLRAADRSEITSLLPLAVVDELSNSQVKQSSANYVYNPTRAYIWSFCSNLSNTLETGKHSNHRKLTGNETLSIQPTANLTNQCPTVIAYTYATLAVMNGEVKVIEGARA